MNLGFYAFVSGFHFGNGVAVEDADDAVLEASVEVVGAESLALLAKVADVELEAYAEFVADFLLPKTISRTLLLQECADFADFVG